MSCWNHRASNLVRGRPAQEKDLQGHPGSGWTLVRPCRPALAGCDCPSGPGRSVAPRAPERSTSLPVPSTKTRFPAVTDRWNPIPTEACLCPNLFLHAHSRPKNRSSHRTVQVHPAASAAQCRGSYPRAGSLPRAGDCSRPLSGAVRARVRDRIHRPIANDDPPSPQSRLHSVHDPVWIAVNLALTDGRGSIESLRARPHPSPFRERHLMTMSHRKNGRVSVCVSGSEMVKFPAFRFVQTEGQFDSAIRCSSEPRGG